MRHIRYTLIYIATIFASLPALVGCTQNKGDIGDWFGIWRVDSIEVDSKAAPDYDPPYMFWKFQSGVVQLLFITDESDHIADFCYGTWDDTDGYLTLNFDWDLSIPPAFTRLQIVTRLSILRHSGDRIELQYIDSNGNTINYKLQKWG